MESTSRLISQFDIKMQQPRQTLIREYIVCYPKPVGVSLYSCMVDVEVDSIFTLSIRISMKQEKRIENRILPVWSWSRHLVSAATVASCHCPLKFPHTMLSVPEQGCIDARIAAATAAPADKKDKAGKGKRDFSRRILLIIQSSKIQWWNPVTKGRNNNLHLWLDNIQ